jgi:hypothetical protein
VPIYLVIPLGTQLAYSFLRGPFALIGNAAVSGLRDCSAGSKSNDSVAFLFVQIAE